MSKWFIAAMLLVLLFGYIMTAYAQVGPCQIITIVKDGVITNCTICGTIVNCSQERMMSDQVNHPKHYTSHPSGVECIQITEHMGFCLGNAVKYIWRADEKNDAVEDLRKARWYIDREIARRMK